MTRPPIPSFGVAMPNAREGGAYEPGRGFGTIETIRTLGLEAERLGFDTLWLDDHLAEHARHDGQPAAGVLESVTVSTYLASLTTTVRIGTGVIVMPLREPVLLARQYATLDHVSGGRAILGVGIGGREELELIRPDEASIHRWNATVERTRAIQRLLGDAEAACDGPGTRFGPITFNPGPIQSPLPIHVATHLEKNLEVVAQFANGWHIAGKTPSEVASLTSALGAALAATGRSGEDFERIGHFSVLMSPTPEESFQRANEVSPWMRRRGAIDHPGYLFGTPERVAERLGSYLDAGLTGFCIIFLGGRPEESLTQLQRFAGEVMSSMPRSEVMIRPRPDPRSVN